MCENPWLAIKFLLNISLEWFPFGKDFYLQNFIFYLKNWPEAFKIVVGSHVNYRSSPPEVFL